MTNSANSEVGKGTKAAHPHASRRLLAALASVLLAGAGLLAVTGAGSAGAATKSSTTTSVVPAAQVGTQSLTAGTWTVNFDWSCDGSYSSTSMVFASGGTWSGGGYSGKWVSLEGKVIFNFSSSTTVYAGTAIGASVTGTQTTFTGTNGCFYMVKAATASTQQKARDSHLDMAGNR